MSEESSLNMMENFAEEINNIERIDLAILRTHLYAEHYIDEAFKTVLNQGDEITDLSFYDKYQVLKALDIFSEDLLENIKLLNRMRNKLVHNLEIDRIYDKKIEPNLQKMNWLDDSAAEVYENHEDSFGETYVYKLIFTITVMENVVGDKSGRY